MRRALLQTRKWALLTAAGGLFVLSGCDPTVRDTVLSGVEGASTVLTTTFLQAFFESLMAQDEGAATIVQAAVETAQIFA